MHCVSLVFYTWDGKDTFSHKLSAFNATLVSSHVWFGSIVYDKHGIADYVFCDAVFIIWDVGQLFVVFEPFQFGFVAVDLTIELNGVVGEAFTFLRKVLREFVVWIAFCVFDM